MHEEWSDREPERIGEPAETNLAFDCIAAGTEAADLAIVLSETLDLATLAYSVTPSSRSSVMVCSS